MGENKKQIVRGFIRTNKVGSRCEFDFEIDAGTPPEQIEEMAREAAFESVEWNYSVEEKE